MNIVQIGAFPLNPDFISGGVESSVYGLSVSLAKSNKVFVIDFPRNSLTSDIFRTEQNLEIFHPRNRYSSNPGALLRIKSILKYIKKAAPDVCHIHGSNYFSLILILLLRLKRYPVMLTIHGLLHIEQRNRYKKHRTLKSLSGYIIKSLSEFLLISLSKRIIVDTQYVSEQIIEYKRKGKILRIPEIHIIPQGINEVFFTLKRNPVHNNLLSVGAFTQRKGHLYTLQALKLLSEDFPDIKLNIAGGGSDKAYLTEVKSFITNYNLEERVELNVDINFNQLTSLYSMADVFVLHSEEESQGIVLAEAMACGLPIVTTNSGGIPYIIEENKNGLLSNYGNIISFVCNLNNLLTDDTLKEQMSEINKKEAEKYNWENISSQIMEIYKNIAV